MRRYHSQLWSVALLAALVPFLPGCFPADSEAPQAAQTESQIEPALVFQPVPDTAQPQDNTSDLDSEAAITAVSTDKPLPANLALTESLAEALHLADSGVEESVLLAFITNAVGPFNLGPDEIIFLTDIGLSTPVVAAMLEHDRLLKEAAAQALAAVPPVEPEPEPEPEPDPALNAPTYVDWPGSSGSAEALMPISYTSEPYPPPQVSAEAASYFQDALAPYGDWIDVEGYGRCWQPSVVVIHKNWRPYCDRGRWVYTDCGWYWVSDYSWGWAPFHYGRWFRHSRVGWCWAPDKVWGPAWVSWRYSDEHCGWAPLPPRAHFTGSGFTYNGRAVAMNFNFGLRPDCYTFVPFQRFQERDLSRHVLAQTSVDRFIHKTTPSTRILSGRQTVMNIGLPREQVASVTRREVRKATIREVTPDSNQVNRPEQLESDGHTLSIVRPNWRPPTRRPAAAEVRHASAALPGTTAQPAWFQNRPDPPRATPRSAGGVVLAESHLAPPAPEVPQLAAGLASSPDIVAPVTSASPSPLPSGGWERPRRQSVPRTSLVVSQPAESHSASDQPQPAVIRGSSQRVSNWRPPVIHHSEPPQQVVRANPASAPWQAPAQVQPPPARLVVPQPAAIRSPAPASMAPSVQETPRWERPRQELSRPAEVRSAPETRNSGARSVERPAAPAPPPAARPESNSRSREENTGGRQRR